MKAKQKSNRDNPPVLSPLAIAIRLGLAGLSLTYNVSHAASIQVTSNLDNGVGCTLRKAIESVNSQSLLTGCSNSGSGFGISDSIYFDKLSPNSTITLTGGQLDIASGRDVFISASYSITINANSKSRVFFTNSADHLHLKNLTISGGSAAVGGGIFAVYTKLTLSSTTVSENYAGDSSSSGDGGGIYAFSTSVTLENSTISGNSAKSDGGGIVAIDSSNVSLESSTISSNSAIENGGGVFTDSRLDLLDSTISNNSAVDYGGAIYSFDYSDLILTNSMISENSAHLAGGIYSHNASLSLRNSTISNNSANSQAGGISIFYGSVSILNSTISNNSANSQGGGIDIFGSSGVFLMNNSVSGNSSGEGGGGISVSDSRLTINNTTISNNSAESDGSGLLTTYLAEITINNSIIANSVNGVDCYDDASTTFTIDASSIIEDGSCYATRSGDPGLLPLADNGGATQTHALKSNSIARNTGILAECSTNDQREQLRDDGDGACDIGAFEFSAIDVPVDEEIFYVIPLRNGKTVVIPL